MVIEAVRKVWLVGWRESGCRMTVKPLFPAHGLLQMTKGSVGSLLVFDASKIGTDGKPSEEAVVGIITERGM